MSHGGRTYGTFLTGPDPGPGGHGPVQDGPHPGGRLRPCARAVHGRRAPGHGQARRRVGRGPHDPLPLDRDRDRLLADVLWAETKSGLDALAAVAALGPYPHTETIAVGFIDILCGSEAVRSFLLSEGQRGLQALTVPSNTYRTRLLDYVTESIENDAAHGYVPPEDPRLLADTVISMTERFLHNGGEPDANPSPEMAQRAIALLLRE